MMGQTNDRQLLDDYVSGNSQEAFATIVQRHMDLVYSVALRRVGEPDKAHEVTATLKLMAWLKLKTAVIAGAASLLAAAPWVWRE